MTRPTCPACGKVCHTKAEAKAAAASLRRWRVNRRIGIYRCPEAARHPDSKRLFHVGHVPSRRWKPGPIG